MRIQIKIPLRIISTCFIIGAASSTWATSIGVSFIGRAADPDDLLAPIESAGVVPQTRWNNLDSQDTFKGMSGPLTDSAGNVTDVKIIYDASDSWDSAGGTTTGDEKLMKGIIKANPEPDTAPINNTDRMLFVITNLPPAGTYNVIVYLIENDADAGMGQIANVDVTLGSRTYYVQEEYNFTSVGTFIPATSTTLGAYADANYAGFTNVSPAANGTITITAKKNIVTPQVTDGIGVAGIQIVQVTGPAFPNSSALSLSVTQQPFNRRAAVGTSNTTFAATTQGPVIGAQWFKNSAPVSGGTLLPRHGTNGTITAVASYAPVVGSGDNGASFYAVLSNNVNSVQSSNGVLTLGSLVPLRAAREQLWGGHFRDEVENGTLDLVTPDQDYSLPTFQTPSGQSDNYADRLSAIFRAPVNGNYVFFVNADDDADLFLSTDATPVNKTNIAQEINWSSERNWTGNNGGGGAFAISQKRSDQWSPDLGTTVPFTNGIPLVAGNSYYMEIAHHDGTGGDFCEATFKLVGEPDPTIGTSTRITRFLMAPYVQGLDGGFISLTQQPQNVVVAQGQQATFSIGATASYIGDNSGASPGLFMQWQSAPSGSSSFADIAGANSSPYTTPILALSDTGKQFRVAMLAGDVTSNSAIAVVTVINDTNPPVVLGAGALSGATKVGVTFDEALDATSGGNPANYQVNGVAAAAATVLTNNPPNGYLVQLTVASAVSANFTLQVSRVKDKFGNTMGTNTVTGTVINLNYTDIGSAASDPGGPDPNPAALPAIVNIVGPGAIDVLCNGNDYWNNADGFNFLWAPKTNSFDVKVRVASVENIDNWSAGAIEVREGPVTTNGGGWELARHYFCKVDYGGPLACLDGTGSGANSYEFNCRRAPGDPTLRETSNAGPGLSQGWGGTGPGGFSPVPFPNAWIRIARVRNTDGSSDHLFGYSSTNGMNWDQRQDVDLNDDTHAGWLDSGGNRAGPWPSVCYVGLGSTSHTGVGNGNDTNSVTSFPYQCWVVYREYGDVAAVVTPALSLTRNGDGTITLTYTGTLYSAVNVTGTYAVVPGATSPYTVNPRTAGPTTTFYRAGP